MSRLIFKLCHIWISALIPLGVLSIMAYMGRLCLKEVPFTGFRYMRSSCVMFVAAVCILFLVKLKWPKNKSVYDFKYNINY